MWSEKYLPAGGMPATPWGKEMDYNLVHREGISVPQPATKMAGQSKRDEHSIIADALFVDVAKGDFRVKDGSPALKLGFVNFPMDQFGVQKPGLKAIARTPEIPKPSASAALTANTNAGEQVKRFAQAQVRNISGLGDRSAYGLPDESGVLVIQVPADSTAAKAGLKKDDVIVACDGKPVRTVNDLVALAKSATGKKLKLTLSRQQQSVTIQLAGRD